MNETRSEARRSGRKSPWGMFVGTLLGLIGLWLAGGGAWLLWLGGSAYYLIAGVGCLSAALLYLMGRERTGMLVYLAVFAGTCIWAFSEVGADFWQLVPRIVGPAVFAGVVVVHRLFRLPGRRRLAWWSTAALTAVVAAFFVKLTLMPEVASGRADVATVALPGDDWAAYGRTESATRFSPAAQITPANVGALEVAWTLRTGDLPSSYPAQKAVQAFEATPLKIGDLVYLCTPHDVVLAVDADTGRQRWRFDPQINTKGAGLLACRGVSYFQASAGSEPCARRILFGTMDARLIALDALSGRPCEGFGRGGTVQLRDGLGVSPDGYYAVTSPPAISNGIAVVGGFIFDGLETNEPSGVVRGYDAETGELAWSWDSGATDENWLPKPGEHYTRGSPNSWSVMSTDPELGLVYVPMGNATPDYVGTHRTHEHNRYSSSVVALDIKTGKRRWHFQTVHHDLWDYDVGSQPVLFDMPMPDGRKVPALAQPTKQGDIYILDRRTGEPLTPVVERPAPRGHIPGERYAPTQPVSAGFPSPLSPVALRERDMWGATPLDQLLCRIRFRSTTYSGRYTPPSTLPTLQYPSNFGVMDWGSVAIDERTGTMFVNSSHLPMIMRLIPREDLDRNGPPKSIMFSPQVGTPYGADPQQMLSPLGIPCNAPPWGKLMAIDLATRSVKWERPLGTSRDQAPFGIAVPGAPNIAGSVVTAGGVLFIGAATDDYLRAFDTATGRELWRARLPAGGQAAPMTYVSGRSGRQFVVIAAGGHQVLGTKPGDYVIAYALPQVRR